MASRTSPPRPEPYGCPLLRPGWWSAEAAPDRVAGGGRWSSAPTPARCVARKSLRGERASWSRVGALLVVGGPDRSSAGLRARPISCVRCWRPATPSAAGAALRRTAEIAATERAIRARPRRGRGHDPLADLVGARSATSALRLGRARLAGLAVGDRRWPASAILHAGGAAAARGALWERSLGGVRRLVLPNVDPLRGVRRRLPAPALPDGLGAAGGRRTPSTPRSSRCSPI